MVIQLQTTTKNLYDTDYNLWVMETVDQLKNKNFDAIDLENLIEEVSDLSRRDKKKLKSLLRNLLEHLLKLKYWEFEIVQNRNFYNCLSLAQMVMIGKQMKVNNVVIPSLY